MNAAGGVCLDGDEMCLDAGGVWLQCRIMIVKAMLSIVNDLSKFRKFSFTILNHYNSLLCLELIFLKTKNLFVIFNYHVLSK